MKTYNELMEEQRQLLNDLSKTLDSQDYTKVNKLLKLEYQINNSLKR